MKVDSYKIGWRGAWDTVQASLTAYQNNSDVTQFYDAKDRALRLFNQKERVSGVEASLDVNVARAWKNGGGALWVGMVTAPRRNALAPLGHISRSLGLGISVHRLWLLWLACRRATPGDRWPRTRAPTRSCVMYVRFVREKSLLRAVLLSHGAVGIAIPHELNEA